MSVIAGNWKMHHAPRDAEAFFDAFDIAETDPDHEIVIFPPTVSLWAAHRRTRSNPRIRLGAQNVHWRSSGAYTGELSASMAVRAGASHVLVGHSERRAFFGESDEEVARKTAAALHAGAIPVICLGETIEEKRSGMAVAVVGRQLGAVLGTLAEGCSDASSDLGGGAPGPAIGAGTFLVAYEPVWAIGTGETATPEDAELAHAAIREQLADVLGAATATRTPILYGGSVKPDNARELLSAAGVDGVLVGGASLNPHHFAAIAGAAP